MRLHCCFAPKKDGTEAIGGDESLRTIGSKQPLAAAEGLFQERNSRVWDTHALRAEARRGGGAREQQAQHEQQRYTMHDDEGPHGRARNCRSQVPLKPAGLTAKPGPRSALRPRCPDCRPQEGLLQPRPQNRPLQPHPQRPTAGAEPAEQGAELSAEGKTGPIEGGAKGRGEAKRSGGGGRVEHKGRDCVRGVAKRRAGRGRG